MDVPDRDAARSTLTPYVRGTTLDAGGVGARAVPGAMRVGSDPDADDTWRAIEGGSVDAIICCHGVEEIDDPIAAALHWKRVLREGATIAVVLRERTMSACSPNAKHSFSPKAFAHLLRHVGGFEVARITRTEDGADWLVVAERRSVMDMRAVLGMQGAALAEAAQKSPDHRAELYFQFGTILLRAGDPQLASRCFLSMLEMRADDPEATFGLGMCNAVEERWQDAQAWLERAIELSPKNDEAKRWLGLVRLQLASAGVMGGAVGPQSAVRPSSKSSPSPSPSPKDTRPPSGAFHI
jgi:hypothetical protein